MIKCQECKSPYKEVRRKISKDFGSGIEIQLKQTVKVLHCNQCGHELSSLKEIRRGNDILLSKLLKKYAHKPLPGRVAKWIRSAIDLPMVDLVKELRLNHSEYEKREKENEPLDRMSSEIILLKIQAFLIHRKD